MKMRQVTIGLASGAVLAYAAVRTIEAIRSRPGAVRQDAHAYSRIRRTLAVSDVVRSTAGALAFAYGPLAARMARVVRPLPAWARPGVVAAFASLAAAATEFPVALVEGYTIERRYGLTEQPFYSYVNDALKSTAIETAIGALLATIGGAALRRFPRSWAIAAAAGAFPLYVLANVVVPLYILPMFNRFEPLQGPLERRLRALATRYGVGDADILTMNMSRQTKKANAFVAGIGRTHRIVLGDTLIEHFEPDEIEFVIAHELGHYVSRDTWRLTIAAEIATALLLVAASRSSANDRSDDAVRIMRVAALLGAGAQLLRPALAAFSRSREWAADRFALDATGNAPAGASAFRRLRDQNLAEEDVPAWYEFFFGTHPSLGKRIAALESG